MLSAKASEYVDSTRLIRRLKHGNVLSCSIRGNYGTYKTDAHARDKTRSSCTCPSENVPCKHVEALRETYRIRPRSFTDIDAVVKELETRSKEKLLALIREMALTTPTALAALGIKGFEEATDDGEETDFW